MPELPAPGFERRPEPGVDLPDGGIALDVGADPGEPLLGRGRGFGDEGDPEVGVPPEFADRPEDRELLRLPVLDGGDDHEPGVLVRELVPSDVEERRAPGEDRSPR